MRVIIVREGEFPYLLLDKFRRYSTVGHLYLRRITNDTSEITTTEDVVRIIPSSGCHLSTFYRRSDEPVTVSATNSTCPFLEGTLLRCIASLAKQTYPQFVPLHVSTVDEYLGLSDDVGCCANHIVIGHHTLTATEYLSGEPTL